MSANVHVLREIYDLEISVRRGVHVDKVRSVQQRNCQKPSDSVGGHCSDQPWLVGGYAISRLGSSRAAYLPELRRDAEFQFRSRS
jgi:hypothetical protein